MRQVLQPESALELILVASGSLARSAADTRALLLLQLFSFYDIALSEVKKHF